MRLEKIVLNGFKSFADKTEFCFGPGAESADRDQPRAQGIHPDSGESGRCDCLSRREEDLSKEVESYGGQPHDKIQTG